MTWTHRSAREALDAKHYAGVMHRPRTTPVQACKRLLLVHALAHPQEHCRRVVGEEQP